MQETDLRIRGHRVLSQADVDLMNRVKEKSRELLALHAELMDSLKAQEVALYNRIDNGSPGKTKQQIMQARQDAAVATEELRNFRTADPYRWASIGKTDIQTGTMALVRAIGQSLEG